MGSGREPHAERARPLGLWLARQGVHLLTGGGGGAMACVCAAFVSVPRAQRLGVSIGVLPAAAGAADHGPPEGYPHPWIEIPVRTHLTGRGAEGTALHSRNSINVLSADLIVALPGNAGTASEVELALRFGRPVVVHAAAHEAAALPAGARRIDGFDALVEWLDAEIERLQAPRS